MQHVMVDTETLGTQPGCVILSIGAVYFDVKEGLGHEMYTVIHKKSCIDAGLFVDPATEKWWLSQSPEARQVLTDADNETVAYSLANALAEFDKFIKLSKSVKVWGNGADFDNPLLVSACRAVGVKQAWTPYNGRCYRTIKNLFPLQKLAHASRTGTHHNALEDAKSQALHLIELAKKNKLVLG